MPLDPFAALPPFPPHSLPRSLARSLLRLLSAIGRAVSRASGVLLVLGPNSNSSARGTRMAA